MVDDIKLIKDDDLLCESANRIGNAVFEAICSIACKEEQLEWDMSLVGPVAEYIEDTLGRRGINTCYPWEDENECICYATDGRCKHCTKQRFDEGGGDND